MLEAYQADPDDVYLLPLGLGAVTGGLTNIDLQGAASMAFHADPAMLQHDPYRQGHASRPGVLVLFLLISTCACQGRRRLVAGRQSGKAAGGRALLLYS